MRSQSNPEKHLTHQVDVVLTPDLNHYGKLVCRECGGQWIQWLSRADATALVGPQEKKTQKNTKSNWSNTGSKERQHYKSFQPSFGLPRTPTQLINDRLALTGYSKHNGNSIYSVPVPFLQSLLDTNKINKKEDRQRIQAAIKLRIGT